MPWGARWPLTVPGGCLVCEPGRRVVFVHAGRRYAVNGAAVADLRTRPLEAIWADEPELEGMKMDVGALVGRGLNICPQQEHTRGRRRARTSAR